MLTPRGLTLCLAAAVAWGLGRLLGVDELYVVSMAAIAMVVLAIVSTRLSSTRIAVRRSAGAMRAAQREPVAIELALRNDGRLPASLLLVEDHAPSGIVADDGDPTAGARFVVHGLRARQVVTLRWQALGRRRGRYAIGPVRIRLRDPFGLAERTRRYRATDNLVVFPAIEPLAAGGGRGTRQGAETSAVRRAFHRGEEFYTMRNYVVGDDLRHVHWPSTAHRGALMVRQHELPWNARAVVYLDTRGGVHRGSGPAATFERAVSAAASVVRHLHDERYDLRLLVHGTDAVAGIDTVDAALVRLAEVSPISERSALATIGRVGSAGDGLLVAVLRPPPGTDDLVGHTELRALLRAGHHYRACAALVIVHHDEQRSATFARLLQLGGWHAATAAPGEPLTDAWRRAMVGATPTDDSAGAGGPQRPATGPTAATSSAGSAS